MLYGEDLLTIDHPHLPSPLFSQDFVKLPPSLRPPDFLNLLTFFTMMCPQSWRGSPASLQLSQSPYSRPSFMMPSRCSPLKFFVSGASQISVELPSLPRSSPVFSGVLQSLPELLLVRRSSCYFLRAPFPRSSSEILCEASPVFRELSCCLL